MLYKEGAGVIVLLLLLLLLLLGIVVGAPILAGVYILVERPRTFLNS
jgi:hypothetical protein